VDFDDVAYDEHADLLYDLAGQTVRRFLSYLSESSTRRVLQLHQKPIAGFIHTQMQNHYWEDAVDYEVKISKGFTELKESAYTASVSEPPLDYHVSPDDKSNMAKYLFGGFKSCLYPVQKFQSDPERRLAVILERESLKWFKPARGQFQIYYKRGVEQVEYQPDFVAETMSWIYMLEPKRANQMEDDEVLAKRDAAAQWCKQASEHARTHGGKLWKYLLIPHNAIAENMTLEMLAQQFGIA
jgi:type III restriction enzyme